MDPIFLNPALMGLRMPGVLGGLLLAAGKGRGVRAAGSGDCLLLDGAMGLVGVADASERSPRASRAFLQGVSDAMRGRIDRGPDGRIGCFRDAVQHTLDAFPYEDRTTFVCLLSAGEGVLDYVCGGDSLLFHLDTAAPGIRFRNRSNMGFAGRSRQIVDAGRLTFRPGDLALLATDGVWDLTGGDSGRLIRAFFSGLEQGPFHEMPERLARERHPAFFRDRHLPFDDFAALLLDPFRIGELAGRIVAGGTGGRDAGGPLLEAAPRALPDRYLRLPLDGRDSWTFPEDLPALDLERAGS